MRVLEHGGRGSHAQVSDDLSVSVLELLIVHFLEKDGTILMTDESHVYHRMARRWPTP